MESVIKIASYIVSRYQSEFGRLIDEMKLHKLLYFTQRESIIETGEPMFPEEFSAWRYGPVMVSIRSYYATGKLNVLPSDKFINDNKSIFDFIFQTYAVKDSWSLSRLSHGEISWQNARHNLLPEQNGSEPLKIEDIKKDAERIKVRRYLIGRIIDSKK